MCCIRCSGCHQVWCIWSIKTWIISKENNMKAVCFSRCIIPVTSCVSSWLLLLTILTDTFLDDCRKSGRPCGDRDRLSIYSTDLEKGKVPEDKTENDHDSQQESYFISEVGFQIKNKRSSQFFLASLSCAYSYVYLATVYIWILLVLVTATSYKNSTVTVTKTVHWKLHCKNYARY